MSELQHGVPGPQMSGGSQAWTPIRAFARARSEQLRHQLQRLQGVYGLALADQAVVSATSFLTTVMIGRWTDPGQLGAFAIAFSVLASLFTIQRSLITLPYSIQRHRPLVAPQEYAGSALAQSCLMSGLVVACLAAAAIAALAYGAAPELIAMTWALAAVAPFALLREFCRRFSFAHFHVGRALALDSTVAVLQV